MPYKPLPALSLLLLASLITTTNASAWWWGGKDWGGPWTNAHNPWNAANGLPGPRFNSWSTPWTTGWGVPGSNGPWFNNGLYAGSCGSRPQISPYMPPSSSTNGYITNPSTGCPSLYGYPGTVPPPPEPPVAATPVR